MSIKNSYKNIVMHNEKIFSGLHEILYKKNDEVNKLDELITQLVELIYKNQTGYNKSIIIKSEGGYWYFYKVLSLPHKLDYQTKSLSQFLISHKRLNILYIEKSLNDVKHQKSKDLILQAKKLIQKRNTIVKRLALFLGGLKRMSSSIDQQKDCERLINIFLKM